MFLEEGLVSRLTAREEEEVQEHMKEVTTVRKKRKISEHELSLSLRSREEVERTITGIFGKRQKFTKKKLGCLHLGTDQVLCGFTTVMGTLAYTIFLSFLFLCLWTWTLDFGLRN